MKPEQFTSEALRRARLRAGMSARAASAAGHLSEAAAQKAEKGTSQITLRVFARLAIATGMTPQEVWLIICSEGRVDREDAA